MAVWIRPKDTSPVRASSIGILYIIETLGVAFPHINLHVRDWISLRVLDGTDDEQRRRIGITVDDGTIFFFRGIVSMKRPEYCSLSRGWHSGMVDRVNQHAQPEGIRQQDHLLTKVITDLADFSQKLDPGLPFLGRETSLPGEVMNVRHDGMEEIAESRVRALGVDDVNILSNIVAGQVLHRRKSRGRFAATHFVKNNSRRVAGDVEQTARYLYKSPSAEIYDPRIVALFVIVTLCSVSNAKIIVSLRKTTARIHVDECWQIEDAPLSFLSVRLSLLTASDQ